MLPPSERFSQLTAKVSIKTGLWLTEQQMEEVS